MFRHRFAKLFLFLLLAGLVLVGCVPQSRNETSDAPAASAPVNTEEAAPTAEAAESLTPQQVTENFYNWYLDFMGDRTDGSFTNPLVTGAYHESEYLSAAFVAQVDETIAGFENGGYDPILLAQDIPVSFEVQEPAINGSEATLVMLRYWGGNPDPSPMVVHLVEENGRWLINNVTPFEVPVTEPAIEPETPDAVVQAFYDWYLAYIGDPGSDNFRNPMVDKAYRDAPYLTESFVGHIDELLEAFHSGAYGSGYDPFLCAQDIPTEITPDVTFARNDMASVVVRSSFPNQRVTVDLRPDGASWRISNITCAFDPAGAVTAFYTWYLGTIGDRSSDDFRNPLVDGAYRNQPLLAESWVQTVDETLASFEGGGFDPFLLAQDIPQDFSVDPGVVEGTAVVHLQFGPDCVRHLLVTMDDTGRRIANISEDAGLPDEAPFDESVSTTQSAFVSDEYGFSFAFPDGWVLQAQDLNGPGQPDDWPVTAAWLLMPPDVAEALASHSGPPNPEAPVIVAPFNIEVVVGDEAALARVYGDLDGETAVFNTHQATILHRDPGYSHVILAHPQRPDTWVVFTDWVTEFPGREDQAETAVPIWQPLLNSLQFTD
ncbi:MAG: hypothetical protein CL608_21305 [Anaerolineaceae bacterium]|nr:hypothetical protein [Anaerolineaceae bacterium]